MNKLVFDKIVSNNKKKYAYITTPEVQEEVAPPKGMRNSTSLLIAVNQWGIVGGTKQLAPLSLDCVS